jgi:predicted molibdopterin-dependent oxidoreductase YjgC
VVDYVGISKLSLPSKVISRPVDDSNPFFTLDRNYCILCRKCVRACDEVTIVHAIEISRQGDREQVNPVASKTIFESICRSCGECMVRCPTGALVPKEMTLPDKEAQTTCPYCGVGCTMYLGTRAGRIVSVRGDRANPSSRGRLCVKGRFGATEYITHPDRLTSPLVRTGTEFTRVSWDEALGQVATRLSKYKPEEVAVVSSAKCTNEENYVLQKFTRAVLGTHSIDHCARL